MVRVSHPRSGDRADRPARSVSAGNKLWAAVRSGMVDDPDGDSGVTRCGHSPTQTAQARMVACR